MLISSSNFRHEKLKGGILMPENAKEKNFVSVYLSDFQYAKENKEIDKWKESHDANKACAVALDKAINDNYILENYHLDTKAVVNSVTGEFGKERTEFILTAHIVNHDWDGRFSNEVKKWARDKFKNFDGLKSQTSEYHLNAHSILIDGVAKTVINLEKEMEKLNEPVVTVDYHPHFDNEFILKEIASGCTITTGTKEQLIDFCKSELAASVHIPQLIELIDKAQSERPAIKDRFERIENEESGKEEMLMSDKDDMIAIYQLKNIPENHLISFASFDILESQGKTPERDNYTLVYCYKEDLSNVKDMSVFLESVFEKFNMDHPKDFMGHSLSVSDIVAVKKDGEISVHYVDSFGFKQLPQFGDISIENPLKYIEDTVEQNDNSFDGIINNKPTTDELNKSENKHEEKRSIRDYLKKSKEPKHSESKLDQKQKGMEI